MRRESSRTRRRLIDEKHMETSALGVSEVREHVSESGGEWQDREQSECSFLFEGTCWVVEAKGR